MRRTSDYVAARETHEIRMRVSGGDSESLPGHHTRTTRHSVWHESREWGYTRYTAPVQRFLHRRLDGLVYDQARWF